MNAKRLINVVKGNDIELSRETRDYNIEILKQIDTGEYSEYDFAVNV